MEAKNIVVVGGGFAGVAALHRLQKKRGELKRAGYRIVLVDPNSYHTYTPSLYELANHEVTSRAIAIPFRSLFGRRLHHHRARVTGIDRERQVLSFGSHAPTLPYEYLLIAAGAVSFDFGIPGISEHALGLKTIEEAVKLRDRLEALAAEARVRKVRVVIAGGGPTGVGLAAELAQHLDDKLQRSGAPPANLDLLLLEAENRLLDGLDIQSAERTLQRLRRVGVKVFLQTKVIEVGPELIGVDDGGEIAYDLLVWTGGVRPHPLAAALKLPLGEHHELLVDPYQRSTGDPRIFAAGDITALRDRHGHRLPATAEPARRSGQAAADNILRIIRGRALRPARLRHSGYIIPLGGHYGVLQLWGIPGSGRIAWIAQQAVYLYYLTRVMPLSRAFRRWRRYESLQKI